MSGHGDVIREAIDTRLSLGEMNEALAALAALEKERDEALGVRDGYISAVEKVLQERRRAEAAEAERDKAMEALEAVKAKQSITLAKLETYGIKFTDLGCDPENWQHVAFTIYTDLCDVDSIAAAALAGRGADTVRPVSHLSFERFMRTLSPWHRRKSRLLAEDLAQAHRLTLDEAREKLRRSAGGEQE